MLFCPSGCNRKFKHMQALDMHREALHGVLTCRKGCRKQFNSVQTRLDHEEVGHLFSCRAGCVRSFQTSEGRDQHEVMVHDVFGRNSNASAKSVLGNAGCNERGKNVASCEAPRQHQQTSDGHNRMTPGFLQCYHCSRTLQSYEALQQHLVAKHSHNIHSKSLICEQNLQLEDKNKEVPGHDSKSGHCFHKIPRPNDAVRTWSWDVTEALSTYYLQTMQGICSGLRAAKACLGW